MTPPTKAHSAGFKRVVVPDRLDLRDRLYQPSIVSAPPPRLNSLEREKIKLKVLDQRETNACTGFALANVANFLLQRAGRDRETPVSPFMLYSMARRYDEFPGAKADTGSSLRGAMKGWYKHGICSGRLWLEEPMPDPNPDPTRDWWQDAAQRPLGAYYRVDTRSVTDMHVALTETGLLYASAVCHAGWDAGLRLPPNRRPGWRIPFQRANPDDGGHAFIIVGYDEDGFLVLNSWGPEWGDKGLAILTYDDWLEHAMDCWVAQLGVVTEHHRVVAQAPSLRTTSTGAVSLAADRVLRNRELSPFIVNMENNGRLSQSGDFRTQESDLHALVTLHLSEFRKRWNLTGAVIDVVIYAHGGLTSEDAAAETAARWIPALYEAQIFPIFLIWETDLLSTLKNRLEDFVKDEPRPTGGLREQFRKWWNTRVEGTLAAPGSVIWEEMKQNAWAISANEESGAWKLYRASQEAKKALDPSHVRLHLIGHSAGAIVLSHIVSRLAEAGWKFKTVNFMAPAVTVATFAAMVLPHLKSGTVEQYNQFHLTDEMEEKDPTCRPILGYGRSLLYLVSESFEGSRQTPILGMEKYVKQGLPGAPPNRVQNWGAPTEASKSTTHGDFDNDSPTMASIINCIQKARPH